MSVKVGYEDLLSFETDISGVVSLILLFCESPGSLAELGSFSVIDPIARRLLVVIDDYFYEKSSFIRHGPVTHLENSYGDESVLVIDRNEVGIDMVGGVSKLDLLKLSARLLPVVKSRLSALAARERFDTTQPGHKSLLMTGLVQIFGALTVTEIKEWTEVLGLSYSHTDIARALYCSEVVGWCEKKKKGNHSYYIALADEMAMDFNFKPGTEKRDKLRWRADIRAYWRSNDSARFRGIAEAAAAASKP